MKPNERHRLAALLDEMAIRQARLSLRSFVDWAWPILERDKTFLSNWHIDLVCDYLEAVSAGEIRQLVINLPPRYMKSLLVSVFWPCWEWHIKPETRYVFSSYTETLAAHHSLNRRRLIRSRAYRRFAPSVCLTRDQQAKLEFHNTMGGIMVSTSTGGSITGKGGNRLIIDDPHNPTQVESDAQRQQSIDFYRYTLSTRLDDPKKDAVVVVMQRLHTRDLTAYCLDQGFIHLCLPALAPNRTTIVFPRSERSIIRELDEPLWPERQGRAELEQQRRILGTYGFAGQYQQEPVPRTGGMFEHSWWKYFDQPPVFDEVVQSWDLSFKDGEGHDYVVGLVAGRKGAHVYLLDRVKARLNFVDTCRAIKQMVAKYPQTRTVLIEDAANGPAVVSALHDAIPGILAVTPEGGKLSRAAASQAQVEAGQVFLPNPRFPDGRLRPECAWVEDFVDACCAFPKGDHDDDVDALTQLLVYARKRPVGRMSLAELLRDDEDDPTDEGEEGANEVRWTGRFKIPRNF
jgi:predicted phage terminase large subunit-like protein